MSDERIAQPAVIADQPAKKVNLLGLSRAELESLFLSLGEKRFRAEQVMKWIHHLGMDSFESMSNLSKALRERLSTMATIEAPKIAFHSKSNDGTQKWVLELEGYGHV